MGWFELPNFWESAGLKMGSQIVPWINQGLTPEKTANLAKMTVSQAFDAAKSEGYNRNFVPSAGQKAVSGPRYTVQGMGSLLGQNRVPFGAPFNTNVGGGASDLQKLLQNPTVSSIVNNPILKTVARGAGALGTAGMAKSAYDFGNWAGNAAIDTQTADNIGLGRNDMYKYGANFANTDLGKNIFNYGSNLASNWNDFNTNPVNRYGVKNTNLFNSSTFTGTQDLAQAQAQAARNQAVQQSINPVANVPQAQYEASMDNTYKNVATGGGNTGYTGQGSQSRAGVNRPSAPAPRQAPVYHTIRNRGGR